jgi:hypothetical protein
MNSDHYAALWRSSAYEAVPYTDDFPEAYLVLPELTDGAMGQGKATTIDIQIKINSERTQGVLTMTDNGIGITNERRLLSWAAKDPTDNTHRNGHGLKKCLTKFHPDHATAKWEIKYRKRGKGLQVCKGPFLGTDTYVEEIESDETTLTPSGTSIEIEFSLDRLGHNVTDQMILNNIREIIRTRYSNAKLSTVKINLEVGAIKVSSHDTNIWKSFHETVKNSGIVEKLVDNHRVPIDGGHWSLDMYRINCDGRSVSLAALKNGFPHYGLKNMNCSRAHISSDGRMIEAMPLWKLLGKEANHNDLNGIFVFVDFVPTTPDDFKKMPTPCTTKVSFYESDEVFKRFIANAGPVIRRGMAPLPVVRVAPAPTPVVRAVPTPAPVVRAAQIPPPVVQTQAPVARVAPTPAPAPTSVVPVRAVVQTQSPIVIVAPPVVRAVPVPPPTPMNSPILTFRRTPADILVLENHDILYTIPYKSSYRTTEEYYQQTLDSIGAERFKRWAAEQVRANQILN